MDLSLQSAKFYNFRATAKSELIVTLGTYRYSFRVREKSGLIVTDVDLSVFGRQNRVFGRLELSHQFLVQ